MPPPLLLGYGGEGETEASVKSQVTAFVEISQDRRKREKGEEASTSIRLSVNDKFSEEEGEMEAAAFPSRKMSPGQSFPEKKRRERKKTGKSCSSPCLREGGREKRELGKKKKRERRQRKRKTHFFCDLAPAPVSLKPLANGLWSILSWVI